MNGKIRPWSPLSWWISVWIVSAACTPAPPSPEPDAPSPWLPGVHIAETSTPGTYLDHIQKSNLLGARVVRVPVDWAALEPVPGRFDVAYVQDIQQRFEALTTHEMQGILLFSQSPSWASGSSLPTFPPDTMHLSDYASAVRRLIHAFSPPARAALLAVEIWNEPNSIEFWPRTPLPRSGTYVLVPLEAAGGYARLLKTAHDTLRQAFPDLPVLGGSLASADTAYLRALFDSLGPGAPAMEGLAVHPYTRVDEHSGAHYGRAQYPDQCNIDDPLSPPWCFQQGLENLRNMLDAHGFAHLPLWITEFGVSSDTAWGDAGSEEEQALHLRIALDILQDRASTWHIRVALWYRLMDEGTDHFGLYNESGTLKPAGVTFKRFATGSSFAAPPPP